MLNFPPKWHDPSHDELSFANELLQFHFQSALEDLLTICQTKVHSETGRYASSGHGNDLAIYFFITHL
jgi:proteasome activator subunit 4